MKRICIEEVGVEEFEETKKFQEKLKLSKSQVNNDRFDKFLDSSKHYDRKAGGDSEKNAHDGTLPNPSQHDKIMVLNETSSDLAQNDETKLNIERNDDNKSVEPASSFPMQSQDSTLNPSQVQSHDPPLNSFQFQAHWKILRNKELEFFQYLKVSNYVAFHTDHAALSQILNFKVHVMMSQLLHENTCHDVAVVT